MKREHVTDEQVVASVNNLGVALFDRGLHMRSHVRYVNTTPLYEIAIYREHIKPTTMWWDHAMMEEERVDTN